MLKYKIVYNNGTYTLFKKRFLFYKYIGSYASLQAAYESLDKIHYFLLAAQSAIDAPTSATKK